MSFLSLFRYPSGSGRALLAGTLHLMYCAARFAYKTTTWRLPVTGRVVDLDFADNGDGGEVLAGGVCQEVRWVRGSGPVGKEFDLTENPLHTSRVSRFNLGHVCGRDCVQ